MTQVEALPPFDVGSLAPNILRPLAGRLATPLTRLVCPTCRAKFHPAAVAFRCAGEPAACPPEYDRVAGARLGGAEPPLLPHAVPPQGGTLRRIGARFLPPRRVACDLCGTQTDHRLCPACHAPLPRSLGAVDVVPILVAGTTGSGKSTWLGTLSEKLESGAGAIAGAAFWPESDWAERRLRQFYRDPLYAQGRPLRPTPPVAKDGSVLEPLFERYDQRKGRGALLALHDTSGADLASDAGVAPYGGAIAAARGVVFLIAPEDLPEFGGNAQASTAAFGRIVSVLEAAGRARPDGSFELPVALVLAKLDRVQPSLPEGVDMLAPADPSAVGSAPASDEVSAYLAAWQGGAIPALLRARFPNHAFFAASALGRPPIGETVEPPRPFRVEEPMLWLLAAMGRLRTS